MGKGSLLEKGEVFGGGYRRVAEVQGSKESEDGWEMMGPGCRDGRVSHFGPAVLRPISGETLYPDRSLLMGPERGILGLFSELSSPTSSDSTLQDRDHAQVLRIQLKLRTEIGNRCPGSMEAGLQERVYFL